MTLNWPVMNMETQSGVKYVKNKIICIAVSIAQLNIFILIGKPGQ
jgi:hypothetical protein